MTRLGLSYGPVLTCKGPFSKWRIAAETGEYGKTDWPWRWLMSPRRLCWAISISLWGEMDYRPCQEPFLVTSLIQNRSLSCSSGLLKLLQNLFPSIPTVMAVSCHSGHQWIRNRLSSTCLIIGLLELPWCWISPHMTRQDVDIEALQPLLWHSPLIISAAAWFPAGGDIFLCSQSFLNLQYQSTHPAFVHDDFASRGVIGSWMTRPSSSEHSQNLLLGPKGGYPDTAAKLTWLKILKSYQADFTTALSTH